jgi:arylsulfatase A-like enzyme
VRAGGSVIAMVGRSVQSLRIHAVSGAGAGGVVGLVDGLSAAARAEVATFGTIAAPTGIGLFAGTAVGLVLGLLIGALTLAPKLGDERIAHAWPPRLLAPLLLGVPLAPVLYAAFSVPAHRFARPGNQVAASVLIALFTFAFAWPLADALHHRLARWLGPWLPAPRGPGSVRGHALWSGGLIGAALMAIAVGYFASEVEVALGPAPYMALAIYGTGHWILAVGLFARAARTGTRLGGWPAVLPAPVLGGVLFLACAGTGGTTANLMAHSHLAPRTLTFLWPWFDRDGDGYAGWLGGGDCDDDDPSIHPAAVDIPGDGIDQNCSGRDAKPLTHPFTPAAVTPTDLGDLPRPRNVVLITIEALRWDAIDTTAESRTPHMAALAAESTWFERAYAPGPATHLTLCSLMTGRYPSRLRWDLGGRKLRETSGAPTLAQRFARRGYTNWAFVSNVVHRRMSRLRPGFDRFERAPEPDGSSKPLVDAAVDALATHSDGAPFFLWLHLVEPHWPHQSGQTGTLQSGYRAEVAAADRHVGTMRASLTERGLEDDTLVVVTGDHAEALGAHGVKTHGVTLYETEVRVPLLIHLPGAPARRRAEPVTLVDIAPTLMDGLEIPSDVAWDGRSLLPPIVHGTGMEPRVVLSESYNPLRPPAIWLAVYWNQWKLLRRLHEGRDEVFDVVADPLERRNLVHEPLDVIEALKLQAAQYTAENAWDR